MTSLVERAAQMCDNAVNGDYFMPNGAYMMMRNLLDHIEDLVAALDGVNLAASTLDELLDDAVAAKKRAQANADRLAADLRYARTYLGPGFGAEALRLHDEEVAQQ